jgi:hypothetical protein
MLFKRRCTSVKQLMERGIPKLEKNIVAGLAGVVVKTSRDWGVCVMAHTVSSMFLNSFSHRVISM